MAQVVERLWSAPQPVVVERIHDLCENVAENQPVGPRPGDELQLERYENGSLDMTDLLGIAS